MFTRKGARYETSIPTRLQCAEICRMRVVAWIRSEEHTSELQSRLHLVCRLLLEKKKNIHRFHAGPLVQARLGTDDQRPAGVRDRLDTTSERGRDDHIEPRSTNVHTLNDVSPCHV